MAHIRDVHAQLPAVFHFQQRNGIVDVLGGGGVDGEDGPAAQIGALFHVRGLDALQLAGLGLHLFGEVPVHAGGVQQGLGAVFGGLGTAEAQCHAHPVVLIVLAPAQQLHRCLVAVRCAARGALFHLQTHKGAFVRQKIQPLLLPDNGAHKVFAGLHHCQDLTLPGAGHLGPVEQLHQHPVAGQCAAQRPAGNEDIALLVVFRRGKAKAGAQLDQHALQRALGLGILRQEIGAALLADLALFLQLLHRLLHLFVVAQLVLQFFETPGLFLQLPQDFGSNGHGVSLPLWALRPSRRAM